MITHAVGDHTVARTDFDRDRLLGLIKQNLAKELSAYHLYNILSIYLDELELFGVREIIDAACARDRRHYQSMLKRFYQLSGTFPARIEEFDIKLKDPAAMFSAVHLNIKEAFEKTVEIKQSTVLGYTRICNITLGRDRKTYLLALSILNEELELKTWFSQFMDARYPEIDFSNPLL